MTIRVFVGVHVTKNHGAFAITAHTDNGSSSFSPELLKGKYTHRYITLYALYFFLQRLSKIIEGEQIRVVFYSNDDEVSFEWNEEYLTGGFAKQTKNKDLWNDVINLVESNNIQLEIKGTENVLNSLNKLERNKARNGIRRTFKKGNI